MVIYVDSLIFTNIIIDYLLLSLTSLITRKTYIAKRTVAAALIGGFSSLYIFVETFVILDMLFQLAITATIVLVSVGCKNFKSFLVTNVVFLSLSFTLSGAAALICRFQQADILLSDNMVYYLNVSPIVLIIATVVVYFMMLLIRGITQKINGVRTAELKILLDSQEFSFEALIDTGNNISDPFGNSPVFIINKDEFDCMNFSADKDKIDYRKRLIPAKTVGEKLLLDGIRCDKAVISDNGKRFEYDKPIVAKAVEKVENGCNAIIPYTVLDRLND